MADHPDRLRFFADVPDLSDVAFPESADTAEDKPPRTRVQIAKAGTFTHPVSGRQTLNADFFDRMVANFKRGIPNDKLAVDYDHLPDRGGPTRACGWIVDVYHDNGRLFCEVEWTWDGAFAIRSGEYRYVSMAFSSAYVSDDQTKRGPTLVGLALTNRPFLEGMAPLSLSATFSRDDFELAEEVGDDTGDPSDSPPCMTTFAKIAKVFGLTEDADETTIVAKATEIVTASQTSLEDRAEADGKVVLSKADHAALTTKSEGFSALETEVGKLKADAADQRFRAAFDKAVADCFVAPAEQEAQRAIFDASETAFTAALATRTTRLVNTEANGSGEGAATVTAADKREFSLDGADVDTEGLELHRKAEQYAREHKVDYADAYIHLAEGAAV